MEAISETPPFKVLDTIRMICDAIDHERLVAVDYRIPDDMSKSVWEKLPIFRKERRAGTFNRRLLDAVFVWNKNLEKFCTEEGLQLPAFWFDGGSALGPSAKAKVSNSQEDRIRCRTIASILWAEDSSLTVVAIEIHPWIQRYGNGGAYVGKHTIRNWIKDLNPTPPSERAGRRPKKKD